MKVHDEFSLEYQHFKFVIHIHTFFLKYADASGLFEKVFLETQLALTGVQILDLWLPQSPGPWIPCPEQWLLIVAAHL